MSDIRVRLGGDNSEFRTMMGDSVKTAEQFSGELVERTAKKFGGLSAITTALAVSLGLNIRNIAEQVARFVTGMSKEQEEAFKSLEQLSDRHTQLVMANMQAQLSEEQKYQAALIAREKLQSKVDAGASSGAMDQVRLMKLKIELEDRNAEILAYEKKQREELAKQEDKARDNYGKFVNERTAANEKEFQALLKTMGINEQIAVLKDSIAVKEKLITSGALSAAAADEQGKIVAEQKLQLVGLEAKVRDDMAAKKAAQEKKDADAIARKIAAGETITEGELKTLAAYRAQTAEIEAQNKALQAQVSIRTVHGRSDQDLSDRELAEKIGNLKSGISANQMSDPFGKYDYLNNQSRLDLERAEAEQQLRRSFRTSFAQKGEAALLNFSAFDEQRLRNLIRPEDEARAQRTLESLDDIRTMLQRSGIFSQPSP